ncbi:MAG: hypothetical protein ACOC7V_01740, partial [Spirochaetota bacterium]
PGVGGDRPGPVILVGEIQELFGGRVGDNYDPFSRLYQTGEWIHERALVIPVSGRWGFVVGIGGTGVDYHRQDGHSRGPDHVVRTSDRITIARFRYDVSRNSLTVVDQDGASLLGP